MENCTVTVHANHKFWHFISLFSCSPYLSILCVVSILCHFDNGEAKDVKTTLEVLARQMSGPTFKLRVDEKDILDDTLVYYKSPSFDPKRPLRVYFNDQSALDTGGVKRVF